MTGPRFTVPPRHRDADARVDSEGVLHLGTTVAVAERPTVTVRVERAPR